MGTNQTQNVTVVIEVGIVAVHQLGLAEVDRFAPNVDK